MSQIGMETAAISAYESFKSLYKDAEVSNPLLEEIELSDDGKCWLVTLGFNATETEPTSALDVMLANAKGLEPPREKKKLWRKYKLFRIDSDTGAVTSVKMKES